MVTSVAAVRRRISLAIVTSMLAGALVATGASSAALAATTGSISGSVTGQLSAPLAAVTVEVYTAYGDYLAEAETNASGAFTISGVIAGSYTLKFDATNDSFYAPQYLGGAVNFDSATFFPVVADVAATGKNATLTGGATVSGNVKTAAGANLALTQVCAYSEEWGCISTATSANGNYLLSGLAPGNYTLTARPGASLWSPGSTTLTLTPAQVVTGRNFSLPLSSSIAGKVTAAGGANIPNVEVYVISTEGELAGYAMTSSTGNYSIAGLQAGSYYLQFWPYGGNFVKEFHNDALLFADAQLVSVPASTSTSSGALVTVNAQLAVGATISGTVTNAATAGVGDVSVAAYTADGEFINETTTDGSGDYTIVGLPAGPTKLLFYPDDDSYAQEWWNDSPSTTVATTITVSVPSALTGFDVVLEPSSRISGVVVGPHGEAPPASVALYSANGSSADLTTIVDVVSTDASGAYVFDQLHPGDYVVGAAAFVASAADDETAVFQPSSGGYISTWHGQAADYASASVVTVVSGTLGIGSIVLGYPTFADVGDPTSTFFDSIEWMAAEGISLGSAQPRGKPLYKPADAVSRQAMAAFLLRASGESFTPPAAASFADVAVGSPFFTAIEWMKSKGISVGTSQPSGLPLYKPADPVSRQAMAQFLARYAGADISAAPTEQSFADVPVDSAPAAAIQWMKETGISTGTTQPTGLPLFMPTDAVSRQAMSLFLFRLIAP